jgi:hypothetical protein
MSSVESVATLIVWIKSVELGTMIAHGQLSMCALIVPPIL